MINYVFDESLSSNLAACMRMLLPEADEDPFVVHHDIRHITEEEGIACREGHEAWIAKFAKLEHRILVTCLTSSRRKLVNKLLHENGVRAVHLAEGFSQFKTFDQAWRLIQHWGKIVVGSHKLRAGEAVSVGVNGKVVRL